MAIAHTTRQRTVGLNSQRAKLVLPRRRSQFHRHVPEGSQKRERLRQVHNHAPYRDHHPHTQFQEAFPAVFRPAPLRNPVFDFAALAVDFCAGGFAGCLAAREYRRRSGRRPHSHAAHTWQSRETSHNRESPGPTSCRWISDAPLPCPKGEREAVAQVGIGGGINLAIQPRAGFSFRGKKAQKAPHRSDLVLQACSAKALSHLLDVYVDVLQLDRTDRDLLHIQVIQKTPGRVSMMTDGQVCESANFTHVIRILIAQNHRSGAVVAA